jgi:hypothetical protein
LISILGALLAHVADRTTLDELVLTLKNRIDHGAEHRTEYACYCELTVGSMISAFAAASNTAEVAHEKRTKTPTTLLSR